MGAKDTLWSSNVKGHRWLKVRCSEVNCVFSIAGLQVRGDQIAKPREMRLFLNDCKVMTEITRPTSHIFAALFILAG